MARAGFFDPLNFRIKKKKKREGLKVSEKEMAILRGML